MRYACIPRLWRTPPIQSIFLCRNLDPYIRLSASKHPSGKPRPSPECQFIRSSYHWWNVQQSRQAKLDLCVVEARLRDDHRLPTGMPTEISSTQSRVSDSHINTNNMGWIFRYNSRTSRAINVPVQADQLINPIHSKACFLQHKPYLS
jgi:hypothetical protein